MPNGNAAQDFALHLPWVRSQWVLGHMPQDDDGGGDSTNIVITSSLHLIKILYESQPYAYDVAHSIGVQNGFLHLFTVYRNRFLMFLSFFCFETRGVRCLVKSLLILSFYLLK